MIYLFTHESTQDQTMTLFITFHHNKSHGHVCLELLSFIDLMSVIERKISAKDLLSWCLSFCQFNLFKWCCMLTTFTTTCWTVIIFLYILPFYYAGKAVHSKNQNEHNNNIMNKSVYMTLVYCTKNCLTVCSQVIIQ